MYSCLVTKRSYRNKKGWNSVHLRGLCFPSGSVIWNLLIVGKSGQSIILSPSFACLYICLSIHVSFSLSILSPTRNKLYNRSYTLKDKGLIFLTVHHHHHHHYRCLHLSVHAFRSNAPPLPIFNIVFNHCSHPSSSSSSSSSPSLLCISFPSRFLLFPFTSVDFFNPPSSQPIRF